MKKWILGNNSLLNCSFDTAGEVTVHEVDESGFITVWQLTTSATETLLSDEKLKVKILFK